MKLVQKFIGISLVLVSIFLLLFAASGKSVEDMDITAIVFLIPIGIYLLMTKEVFR